MPRETVYVPMLFRSTIAGYFTESWLLCTQPQLEGGAKVKFTFKAITRCESDYSKQIQEIKDYMKMKEAQNICLPQVQSIIDYAILKAEVTTAYQPVEESMEVIFMKRNPGLYYYGHIVRRLQLLCETYISLNDLEKLENGDIIVSVLDLWQAFLALPDDDDNDDDNDNAADDNDDHDDDNDDHDDDDNVSDDSKNESYINLTRKQTLLWHLYKDFYTMSFQPVLMLETSFHSKYIKMYTLLQTGIDKIVSYAQDLADSLGLAPKKEIIENEQAVEKKEKGNSKSKRRATSKASKVGKKGLTPDHVSPSPTAQKAVPKDVIEFSAAHKFRAENTEQFNPMLAKYDEKVYLEVYRMLSSTIEEMSVLFENK
ncbi:uncharacterized protein LOC132741989 [Ruditapes philippinarum]|uniref:uncharacterized protein LOC132741989 n=1 Tax=Ruditapes philippinarum TaxID=129788 RepID=UPI00295BA2D0|nr:uncharacterized protein LOC132741989 [Ruditapes philippinarum]